MAATDVAERPSRKGFKGDFKTSISVIAVRLIVFAAVDPVAFSIREDLKEQALFLGNKNDKDKSLFLITRKQ